MSYCQEDEAFNEPRCLTSTLSVRVQSSCLDDCVGERRVIPSDIIYYSTLHTIRSFHIRVELYRLEVTLRVYRPCLFITIITGRMLDEVALLGSTDKHAIVEI